MCDFVSSTLSHYCFMRDRTSRSTSSRLVLIGSNPRSISANLNEKKLTNSIKVTRNSSGSRSHDQRFYDELRFKESGNGGEEMKIKTKSLKFDENLGSETGEKLGNEDLVKKIRGSEGVDLKLEELEKSNVERVSRRGRQLMKRSKMIAKQVISKQSARSLGFVSQLWVDTNSWMVLVVEVRPSLLSGELERFLLEDTSQVGDVVLIEDESVMENELKMVGLETLVGYSVVTPSRRNIGKVRGYNFNINSGAIESLELDSFGISIIPSSLVSTYALFVEDVLEVFSDTVVVHEAAASHVQRLTKGLWDAQKMGYSMDDIGEYYEPEREPAQLDYEKGRGRKSKSRRSRSRTREDSDDWELPMDYL